jgi:hypothetical protein
MNVVSIVFGIVGLLTGVGLLIWAVVERGKRSDAEQELLKAKQALQESEREHQICIAQFDVNMDEVDRLEKLVSGLKYQMNELRRRCIDSFGEEALETWINDVFAEDL